MSLCRLSNPIAHPKHLGYKPNHAISLPVPPTGLEMTRDNARCATILAQISFYTVQEIG